VLLVATVIAEAVQAATVAMLTVAKVPKIVVATTTTTIMKIEIGLSGALPFTNSPTTIMTIGEVANE